MSDPATLARLLMASKEPSDERGSIPMRFSWGPRYNPTTNKMDAPDLKGVGFYGPMGIGGNNVAGEYGRTDMINGQLRNYPSVYQGMKPQQLATVLMAARLHAPVPREIDDMAYAKAKERVNAGRSPFWEQGRDPYPQYSPDQYWEAPR